MSKHSPGPWRVIREGTDINIVSEDVPYVAQVFPCPSVDVEYNALLIAASPKMLEALQVAVQALNAIPNKRIANSPYKDSYGVASMLDSVIREAEGG